MQPTTFAKELGELRVHPREIEPSLLQQLIPRAARSWIKQIPSCSSARLLFLAQRLSEVISLHAAATELLESETWDLGAVYYECIDQVGHAFMPYHPPRLPEVAEPDFEFFKDVMRGVYRFHDLPCSSDCSELAGPDPLTS